MSINSAEIDVQKVIQVYGMKNVLRSLIDTLGFETDYEIRLRVDLLDALENYERRYDEANTDEDDED